MEIEPLKIPAFMRKKPLIRKDNSNFYRESEKLTTPAPVKPERHQVGFTLPTPTSAPFVPARPRNRIVSPAPAQSPLVFEEPRYVKPEPVFTPVGVVTHFLDKISVAIIKLDADVKVGDRLVLNGEKGAFRQKLSSMQINRQNVEMAGRGDDIGIKVNKKAIVGEMIYVIG